MDHKVANKKLEVVFIVASKSVHQMEKVLVKVRMGMVGGGEGAFIGAIHRIAANIDSEIELVCGAFNCDPAKATQSGAALGLPRQRVYDDYQKMLDAEANLPTAQRMQFVTIVTPNHMHFPIAEAALNAGFHVMCEKPATFNLAEALKLRELVKKTGLLYGLALTYTGYPLVKEARERVANGELGKIRKIVVEHTQGWLADKQEDLDNKQAAWRVDPSKAGVSSCMGDIGVHAANLAEYVSGQKISKLCADLTSFVSGRALDDDGSVLLRFDQGASGLLHASQICAGEENGLKLKIYGEKGGLEWLQQEPNTLWIKWTDQPTQMLRTGGAYLGGQATANTRTPMGHPEGYLEAFANLYKAFVADIRAYDDQSDSSDSLGIRLSDCPGIEEAVRGMTFIELTVTASNSDTKWHSFDQH